ncbi:hypothetical protein LCL95_11950 [Bacillus timonensis]|nr:hypothetical protein [Bacillus timonensis]
MQNAITRLFVIFAGLYTLYRYRYRIMNGVLGNPWIRKVLISTSMNIPYIRNKMIHQAFR